MVFSIKNNDHILDSDYRNDLYTDFVKLNRLTFYEQLFVEYNGTGYAIKKMDHDTKIFKIENKKEYPSMIYSDSRPDINISIKNKNHMLLSFDNTWRISTHKGEGYIVLIKRGDAELKTFIKIFDLVNESYALNIKRSSENISILDVNPSKGLLALNTYNQKTEESRLEIIDINKGNTLLTIKSLVHIGSFSIDGNKFVLIADTSAYVYDIKTGKLEYKVNALDPNCSIIDISLNYDGTMLAVGFSNGFQLWRINYGKG